MPIQHSKGSVQLARTSLLF